MNLFGYVGNNPINWIDPWGLLKIKGAHDEPIYVHPNDVDPSPSSPHGHIGNPNSPLKVDPYTGEIYQGTKNTGTKLSKSGLKTLQKQLKKAGLLGLALGLLDIAISDDSNAAIDDALDPLCAISGNLSAGSCEGPGNEPLCSIQ